MELIYIYFGVTNPNNANLENYVYKYDVMANTYAPLEQISYLSTASFNNGCAIAIGTNVYLFGGSSSKTLAYKYDTLANTYTQLANIPYNFIDGSTINIGTDIYLFGGSATNTSKYAYKYDTLTNTYTKLSDIPQSSYGNNCIASVDTDIYLLINSYNYKYDTLTNTYTKLSDIPYNSTGGSTINIGTDIYLFGGSATNTSKYAYKYDTLTDTYTRLSDILYDFYNGSIVVVGNAIYLCGSSNSDANKFLYSFTIIKLENKTIAIQIIPQLFKASLSKILSVYFSNAQIYDNEELLQYPVYYGDGQKWIQILKSSRSIITENGSQIITEDNKVIELEEV